MPPLAYERIITSQIISNCNSMMKKVVFHDDASPFMDPVGSTAKLVKDATFLSFRTGGEVDDRFFVEIFFVLPSRVL